MSAVRPGISQWNVSRRIAQTVMERATVPRNAQQRKVVRIYDYMVSLK